MDKVILERDETSKSYEKEKSDMLAKIFQFDQITIVERHNSRRSGLIVMVQGGGTTSITIKEVNRT